METPIGLTLEQDVFEELHDDAVKALRVYPMSRIACIDSDHIECR